MAGRAWLLRNAWRDDHTSHAPADRRVRVNNTTAWVITLARAGYGVALVGAPQVLIKLTGDAITGQPAAASRARPSRRACAVARVLGVRHLVQAGLTAAALRAGPGSPYALAGGAAVDALHATTMVGLALVDRGARRVALADTGAELALATGGGLAAIR